MLIVDVLLNLVEIQVGNLSTLTIEDLGEFLESGTAGLDVKEVDEEELEEVPDVGPVVAESLTQFFRQDHHQEVIKRLKRAGITWVQETADGIGAAPLAGKVVVLTGSMTGMTRDEARKALTQLGAKVTSSVSKNTDMVIAGNEPGRKYAKAKDLGLKVLFESEFRELIQAMEEKSSPAVSKTERSFSSAASRSSPGAS